MEKLHQLSTSVVHYHRWKLLSLILCFFTLSWGVQAQTYGPGPFSQNLVVGADEIATITVQAWAGGGGGGIGSNPNSRRGGGGGGGYVGGTFELGPGNYSISGTIGAGGAPGDAGENTQITITGPGVSYTGALEGGGAGRGGLGGFGGFGDVPGGDGGRKGTAAEGTGGGGGGSGPAASNGEFGQPTRGGNGGTPGGGDGGDNGASGSDAVGPGGGGGGKGTGPGTSGSGGDGMVIINVEISLPVELARFEAQPKENMVELAWTTSSELNNDFFEIEHSKDAINFIPVGKIRGNGTTSQTVNYEYMHRQPSAGVNYYRLKQVDYDGAFEYSKMVVVNLEDRTGTVSVYPNPTVGRTMITLDERPENAKVSITNLLGQSIDLQPVSTNTGWEIDMSTLSKGVYVLRAEYDGKVMTQQVVKQ